MSAKANHFHRSAGAIGRRMGASVLVRLLVVAAAAAVFGALPAPAFGGTAHMGERWVGNRLEASVVYDAYAGEANDLTISMVNQSKLVIRDRGKSTDGQWGWLGAFGCSADNIGEADGTFAVVCEHTNPAIPITYLNVILRDGDDSVRLDSSVLPGLSTTVFGYDGADVLDVRGGSTSDQILSCGSGIDWAYTDPGEYAGEQVSSPDERCDTNDQLGAVLTSAPGVTSWGEGYLDVFWRGASGELRHKAYNAGWHAEDSLGGVLTSKPAAVVWGPWKLGVFARGTDNAIHQRSWQGSWSGWNAVPGTGGATSAPAAASPRPGWMSVFYRGADNRVFEAAYNDYQGFWSSPTALGGDLEITSAPAAASWGQGRLDVFARGGDGALYHQFYEVGEWSGSWTRLGGQLSSAPAVASRGYGKLDVFVRGLDNALYRKSYDMNTDWSDWQRLGGELTQGDPTAVSWGNGRIDVFTRGPRNELYELFLFS
jgi:hypothetical protein